MMQFMTQVSFVVKKVRAKRIPIRKKISNWIYLPFSCLVLNEIGLELMKQYF